MELIFLGTSSMIPTADRNHSAFYLHTGEDALLFDCGEGTQRQITRAKVTPSKIKHIFISHWDGDHVLGLPGFLLTLSKSDPQHTLKLFGPPGTKTLFGYLLKSMVTEPSIAIEVVEVEEGLIHEGSNYRVYSYPLDHRVRCVGYRVEEKDRRRIDLEKTKSLGIKPGPLMGRLQRGQDVEWQGNTHTAEELTYVVKGKIFGYIADTQPCNGCNDIAKGADVLLSESNFLSDMEDKAAEYKHMTAAQAAFIASRNEVGHLYLTHFSNRYKDVTPMVDEAKTIFPEVTAAYDFLKVKF